MSDLIERLLQVDPPRGNDDGTRWYRNPDGREAADRIQALEAALADAIECVESWGAYADAYFQQKHDLAGDLSRLRVTLPPTKEADDE